MGRGEKGPVSCRLSSSSSFLKFLFIMIQLTVVYQFASTWGFTSHHPWLWNSATTATITTVKIPEISFDFVLNHSSRPLNMESAQSQQPPATPVSDVNIDMRLTQMDAIRMEFPNY
ncbi:hypothetical protein CK203_048592 [Vitis vinifera]|uniref:Uncharacterized protein n=1 Tax=Vitis vinifera TaxID=29760 RepID=A0A438HK77_VITVI|nr:hypothetical protein CK203_048592 [Vitis vinifera]